MSLFGKDIARNAFAGIPLKSEGVANSLTAHAKHPNALLGAGLTTPSYNVFSNALLEARTFDCDRRSFSEAEIEAVWQKGIPVRGVGHSQIRKSELGGFMQRDQYGNRHHSLGWEIDHIVRLSDGGSNDLTNLRPLYWRENAQRG